MSLLDFKMPGLDTAEGQGIMAAALSLLQAQKMPGQRGLAGALGGAGQQYMQTDGAGLICNCRSIVFMHSTHRWKMSKSVM